MAEALEKKQNRLSSKKIRLYEEYRSGGNCEEYIRLKEENEKRLAEITETLKNLEMQLETAKQNDIISTSIHKAFAEVMCMDSFDRATPQKDNRQSKCLWT